MRYFWCAICDNFIDCYETLFILDQLQKPKTNSGEEAKRPNK
jgi:hypothetical protein